MWSTDIERVAMPNNVRILVAEAFGTGVLMLGGPGTAILMQGNDTNNQAKILAVALAFGFSLLIMAYAIGPISGCHINPAVTLGFWFAKKIDAAQAVVSVIGQLIGAAAGGAIIWVIARGLPGYQRGGFAANGYRDHSPGGYGIGSAMVVEIVFTALLVVVVLFTTTKPFSVGMGGLVAGITLTLIHLVTIPVDNTSVNPARSFGAAIFASSDSEALKQLWLFIIFPLMGAAVGAGLWMILDPSRKETDVTEVVEVAEAA
jgi:aquaporin Z